MNKGLKAAAVGCVSAAILAAAGALPAAAHNSHDLAARVLELEQKIDLLQRQLERQIQSNAAAAVDEAAAATAAGAAETGAGGGTVSMKGPAPTFSTPDGDHTMSVTGRVHWDIGFYNEDMPDNLDLNDGSNLRRARLGVKGEIMKDWGYEIILDGGDSAADDVDIDTAFVSYKGLKPITLTLGQHKAPLTLEYPTSSNDIPFIERSLSTNLFIGPAGGKRLGLSAVASGGMWWFGAGAFGEKLSVDAGKGGQEQWAYTGRVAVAPMNEKGRGVHLGASGWLLPEPTRLWGDEQHAASLDGKCRFRDRPEFRVDASRWIDTKAHTASDCFGVGGEFAAWFQPAWVAAEYTQFGFDTPDAKYSFNAYYLQAGWVLTGEGRPYSMKKAAWSGVKPADPFNPDGTGAGAFELVARYSYANLDDQDIMGGEQTNYTLGLNWWLNNWIALKFNYIRARIENQEEFDIYALRAQVKW